VKIATIAPLSYTAGKLEYFQFIRGGIGADFHQEPKFFVYADGSVLLYWMAYDANETSSHAVKLFSVSKDQGLTWSAPQMFMADFLGGVPYFVFMQALKGTGKVLMMWGRSRHKVVEEGGEKHLATGVSNYFKSQTRVFLRHSVDGGRTFEESRELPYPLIMGGKELPGVGMYGGLCDLIQLESGRIVAGFQMLDPVLSDAVKGVQHYTLVFLYSDDEGVTWGRGNEVTVSSARGAMECQIVETGRDRLLCLFRTKVGAVCQTVSEDGGKTWGAAEATALPSPESMVRLIKLRSGNLLVVWNNVSSTTQHPRHPMVAALSKDGGKTWGNAKVIGTETGQNQLSNHGMVQLADGRILLGISHYRAVKPKTSDLDLAIFDEGWLEG
jgi:hypothetical protein